MIVAWIPDKETGKVQEILGLYESDEELKLAVLDRIAEGSTVIAGDVTPFVIKFIPPVPPNMEVDRTVSK